MRILQQLYISYVSTLETCEFDAFSYDVLFEILIKNIDHNLLMNDEFK